MRKRRLFVKAFSAMFNEVARNHREGLTKCQRHFYNREMNAVYVRVFKATAKNI